VRLLLVVVLDRQSLEREILICNHAVPDPLGTWPLLLPVSHCFHLEMEAWIENWNKPFYKTKSKQIPCQSLQQLAVRKDIYHHLKNMKHAPARIIRCFFSDFT